MYLNYYSLKLQIEMFKRCCEIGTVKKDKDQSGSGDGDEEYQIEMQKNVENFTMEKLVKLPGYYYLGIVN